MFILLLVSIAAGIAAGLIAHGSFANLKDLQLRWTPILFVAVVVGMVPLLVKVPQPLRFGVLIATMLCMLVFLALNIAIARGSVRAGWATLLVGWILNFVAIAANGGMPLSMWAYARSGQSGSPTFGENDFFKVVIADEGTILRPLGDVIPLAGPLEMVISVGDVFLGIGVAMVIAAGMRARDGAPVTASERP